MIAIPLENLKVDESYPHDLQDERGAVLVPAHQTITLDLIQWIRDRRVHKVFTEELPNTSEGALEEAGLLLEESTSMEQVETLEDPDFSMLYENLSSILSPRMKPSTSWYAKSKQAEMLENRLGYYPGWDKPKGIRFSKDFLPTPAKRTQKYKHELLGNYADALKDVKGLIDKIADGTLANAEPIYLLVNRIIEMFLKDKNLLLNFSLIKSTHQENLYHHSLNVCILAINIGSATGYSRRQIAEIGIGALIHDVGMVLVPPSIRYKQGKLSPHEHIVIQKHPVDGLFMISKIKNLPESTGYIIYQHHEREDGSGYPRNRKSELMHRYARIVGLADMFDALTSKRPYREAFKPYDAMLELLGLAKRGKISADLMRFFIEFASLFPVGSYVRLSNNKIARVVESRGENFTSPVVSIIDPYTPIDMQEHVLLDLSKTPDIEIVEAIPNWEVPNNTILGGF